ncbi:MAG: RIP metalloprotease RseP [Flavobacteriales bacterium]|nr:RIP metalloprotease RseP [Flavobacteriales bacterium]
MEILIQAAQLILSLSILVVLHELGHFIPAKLFKTRVEKFYLFFDPWFSLFKYKKGDTEYGVGWLPLGGYVKISGMIDESMDTEQMKQPAQPWEFRSKKAWQRLIIMSGGVIVNLILGFLIYIMIIAVWGTQKLTTEEMKGGYGLAFDEKFVDMGFQDGDLILQLDTIQMESYGQIKKTLLDAEPTKATVLRNGEELTVNLVENMGGFLVDNEIQVPLAIRIPSVIDSVIEDSPSLKAGLLKGDSITHVNDKPVGFYHKFLRQMSTFKPGDTIQMSVLRSNEELDFTLVLDKNGKIGLGPKDPTNYYTFTTDKYTLAQSIPVGFAFAKNKLVSYVKSLKLLFRKKGAQQVGSFLTIGSLFNPTWDWQQFWEITAFLSLILAVMNLLPIPALDGGHIVFLLYEMIAGKPAPEKVMEKAQIVGFVILIGLMVLAFSNDIARFFFGGY